MNFFKNIFNPIKLAKKATDLLLNVVNTGIDISKKAVKQLTNSMFGPMNDINANTDINDNLILQMLARVPPPQFIAKRQTIYIDPTITKINKKNPLFEDPKLKYSGIVTITIKFVISANDNEGQTTIEVVDKNYKDILTLANIEIDRYISGIAASIDSIEASITFNKSDTNSKYSKSDNIYFLNMVLRENNFIKLPYKINANNAVIKNNCVSDALQSLKSKNYKKAVELSKEIKTWTIKSLLEFLTVHKINHKIFDRHLNIINQCSCKEEKTFMAIVSNEHIYPITKLEYNEIKAYLGKNDIIINKIEYKENLNDYLKEINTKEGIKWFDVGLDKKEVDHVISRLVINDTLYVNDKMLYKSYELTNKMALDFMLKPSYKKFDVLNFISDKYKLESTYTNFLGSVKPIIFNNPFIKENIKCIDKNLDYSYLLNSLEYLPIIKAHNVIKKINNEYEIKDYNFYHVNRINTNTYNIMSVGWCTGARLKHFKNSCYVDALIESDIIKNPYKGIIGKMIELDRNASKDIINTFIGIMQCYKFKKDKIIYKDILYNEHEASKFDNCISIDEYFITYERVEHNNKYNTNRLPIAHYIVDNAVSLLLNKMAELNALDNKVKIVQLKIDSISFSSTKITLDMLNLKENTNIEGWKLDKFIYKKNYIGYHKNEQYTVDEIKKPLKTDVVDLNKSTFIRGLAGNAKSYFIINKIIPELEKTNKKFIIISASHKALSLYKLKNKHNRVIQYYQFNPQFTKELLEYEYIIIEEIGLLSFEHYDLLYDKIGVNTKLIGLGDVNQLLPVGNTTSPLLNYNILTLFNNIVDKKGNWRNNYSEEDYKNMINGEYKLTDKETKLFDKVTDNNICYFNKTVDLLNEKITDKWNDVFGNLKVKIGGKLILCSNELRSRQLYNKYAFIIKKYDDNEITLTDDIDNDHIITLEEFKKSNFKHGYAYTLYYVQGESIDINNISFHDVNLIKANKRALYTALSRIKEELNNKPTETLTISKIIDEVEKENEEEPIKYKYTKEDYEKDKEDEKDEVEDIKPPKTKYINENGHELKVWFD